ncbi:MAG: tyrosine-type recombinase/integrase, partial [Armatimonadota bacterium]|nr:tyrosine-type recombinase/integrase [Armatimonadota bacterium]
GEILNLKVGQIDLKNRQAVVKGKGRKERVIVFGIKAASLLQRWLMVRALRLGVPNDDDFLSCFAKGLEPSTFIAEKA